MAGAFLGVLLTISVCPSNEVLLSSGVRVEVLELFTDLLSKPTSVDGLPPLLACTKSPPTYAPWASGDARRTGNLPSLRELNRSFLGAEAIYNASQRLCTGDARFVSRGAGPSAFCLFSDKSPPTAHFEQHDSEKHMLSRWLQIARTCASSPPPDSNSDAAAQCSADILVVPSLWFHIHALLGKHVPNHNACRTTALTREYWRRVHTAFAALAQRRGAPPLVVMADPSAWFFTWQSRWLEELMRLPKSFTSAIVIGTSLSNQLRAHRGLFPRGWQSNCEAELLRRERQTLPMKAVGPLMCTLPYSVGISAAVDWTLADGEFSPDTPRAISIWYAATAGKDRPRGLFARRVISDVLQRAGASCDRRGEHCLFCALGQNCSRTGGIFAQAAAATFCIEPPGDSLDRSHLYVAALSGCLPVVVNNGHLAYLKGPTSWPWLASAADPGAANDSLALSAQTHASRPCSGVCRRRTALDYAAFSIPIDASDTARFNSTIWVTELLQLARDAHVQGSRVQQLRAGLRSAAPLFTYAPRASAEAGGGRCDAFGAFSKVVLRAWQTHAQRSV